MVAGHWPFCYAGLTLDSASYTCQATVAQFHNQVEELGFAQSSHEPRVSNQLAIGPGSFFFFVFLGPYPQHMEVPRLGVESEMQLLATATASHSNAGSKPHLQPIPQLVAMPDP